ncbi:hypothetical protein EB796_024817 [Bugula neritina]|uniref:Uncharacterized protein n=1 Tax=Bugula neritina TaxID=10212 RepID=A0A7J7ITY7_BUGNE|nr:hypothetical protein EB796_024817 [Bugula neritina]
MASSSVGLPSLFEGGVEVFLERLGSYFAVQKVKAKAKVHVLIMGLKQFRMGINDSLIREKLINMPLAQQEDFEEVIRKAQEVELNRKMSDLSMND